MHNQLPFLVDRPMVQPMMYNQGSPPYLPAMPVHPRAEGIKAAAATAVANEVTKKMLESQGSVLRMFAFNAFSSQGWNNQHFAVAVKMVSDLTVARAGSTGRQIDVNFLQEIAAAVVTVISCKFVFHFVMLQNMLPPQILQTASQNAPQFENIENEIRNMYQNNNQIQGMYSTPQQTIYPGQAMQVQPQQQYPQHNYAGALYGGNPTFGATIADDEDDRYASRLTNQYQVHSDQQQHLTEFATPAQVVLPTRVSSNSHYDFEDIDDVDSKPAPKEIKSLPNNNTNIVNERGISMDREAHRVSYFGGSYQAPLAPRVDALKASVEAIVAKELEEVDISIEFAKTIDLAISESKFKAVAARRRDKNAAIHREYTSVPMELSFAPGMTSYLDEILSQPGFLEIAAKMKSFAKALSELKDESEEEIQETISFLSSLDMRLKYLVEEFIAKGLGIPKLTIDSFVEDVADIPDYLAEKYGKSYADGFAAYEKEVMRSLNYIREHVNPSEADEVEGHKMRSFYSITHLPLNHQELGWKVDASRSNEVEKDSAPTLFAVIESLYRVQKENEIFTLHDLIVTADGIVYQVYDDYTTGSTEKKYRIATFK